MDEVINTKIIIDKCLEDVTNKCVGNLNEVIKILQSYQTIYSDKTLYINIEDLCDDKHQVYLYHKRLENDEEFNTRIKGLSKEEQIKQYHEILELDRLKKKYESG